MSRRLVRCTLMAYAGALTLVGAACGQATNQMRSEFPSAPPSPAMVSNIDVSGDSELGHDEPIEIAVTNNAVWVSTWQSIVRIDPSSDGIVDRISVTGSSIGGGGQGIATDEMSLWVARPVSSEGDGESDTVGELARLDATTGETVWFRAYAKSSPTRVLIVGSSVWFLGGTEVGQVDPATGRISRTIPVPGIPMEIALGAGSLWVLALGDERRENLVERNGNLVRIDPSSGRIRATIRIDGDPSGLAIEGSSVWVTHDSAVTIVDSRSDRIRETIAVGRDAGDVAVAAGRAWVTNFHSDSVTPIDLRTHEVLEPIHVSGMPSSITAGAGSIWISRFRAKAVTRIRLA